MYTTNAKHISSGSRRGQGPFKESDNARPYETNPDGNQIVLEEQMVKMNETKINHNMMIELYRKQLRMFQSVIRPGR